MDATNIVITAIISTLVGLISAYVMVRMLPANLVNSASDTTLKRSATIANLLTTVDKLVVDLEIANKKIEAQREQIRILEGRQDVILKAQLHIILSDPPVLESSKIEYVVTGIEK
jgi:phosphate/sulfate permease